MNSSILTGRTGLCRLAAAAAILTLPQAAPAQVRGGPLFFESSYGYADRLGLELGHGGELDGVSVQVIGAHHFGVGRRRFVSVSGAAGVWDPPQGSGRFSGAVGTQVRLNQRAGMVSRTTIRAITGLGVVSDGGRARLSVPIGIGAGHRFEYAAVHIEPWLVPHVIWMQRSSPGRANAALPAGGDTWKAAISAGLTVGAGKIAGLRIGTECCIGGLAAAYSLSAWF